MLGVRYVFPKDILSRRTKNNYEMALLIHEKPQMSLINFSGPELTKPFKNYSKEFNSRGFHPAPAIFFGFL
jgi:hypothetical protein